MTRVRMHAPTAGILGFPAEQFAAPDPAGGYAEKSVMLAAPAGPVSAAFGLVKRQRECSRRVSRRGDPMFTLLAAALWLSPVIGPPLPRHALPHRDHQPPDFNELAKPFREFDKLLAERDEQIERQIAEIEGLLPSLWAKGLDDEVRACRRLIESWRQHQGHIKRLLAESKRVPTPAELKKLEDSIMEDIQREREAKEAARGAVPLGWIDLNHR